MTRSIKTEIAIVGAGVIGLATALRLAAAGREVVVIDPQRARLGRLVRQRRRGRALWMRADRQSRYIAQSAGPVHQLGKSARHSHAALPALLPWLSRFAWQSMPMPARRNGRALAGLLNEALPAWRDLAAQAGEAGRSCRLSA